MQGGQKKKNPTRKIGQYILSSADSKNSLCCLLQLLIVHTPGCWWWFLFLTYSPDPVPSAGEDTGSRSTVPHQLPPPAPPAWLCQAGPGWRAAWHRCSLHKASSPVSHSQPLALHVVLGMSDGGTNPATSGQVFTELFFLKKSYLYFLKLLV